MAEPDHPDIARAKSEPVLELPAIESPQAKGIVLDVARVATAPAGPGSDPLAWIETRDGRVFRLPEVLFAWASTTVAVALSMGNMFPSEVEFGIVDGHPYAEIL